MEIDAGIGLTGNGGADGVDDADDTSALVTCLAKGGERVGGFARLTHDDHDGAIVDDRVSISKLGGVFDFGGDACELLEEVFSHQSGVPGGATTGDDDSLGADQLAGEVGDSAERDAAFLLIDATAHAVGEGVGLLHDFLEHEVFVASEFDVLEGHFQLGDLLGDGHVVQGGGSETVFGYDGHLAIVQINGLRGVL